MQFLGKCNDYTVVTLASTSSNNFSSSYVDEEIIVVGGGGGREINLQSQNALLAAVCLLFLVENLVGVLLVRLVRLLAS